MDTPGELQKSSPIERGLPELGVRREVRIAGIRVAGRRRRPSGEKAPLQRELRTAGRLWLLGGIAMVALWITLFAFPETTDWWTDRDNSVLRWFVDLRNSTLTSIADAVALLGSTWFLRILRIGTLVALIFVRRWRHFFAVILVLILVQGTVEIIKEFVGRPRPFVPIIGDWNGPSHPSRAVAGFGVTASAMAYTLVPSGRRRQQALGVAGVMVVALVLAKVYLGVSHPTDAVVSAIFSTAVVVVLFRWFAPEAFFPVSWKRGVTAHLDVSGERGEAIKRVIGEQLGMEVLEIKPFGLEGSGGSTPLRLKVAGDPDQYVFAKLYSQVHLRSDRWYKVGRTILYGSLEDELRFTSVRRLVEYEDYIQRLMRDAGVPSAVPLGIVEITPEREYLMVSEFLPRSQELTDAEIDETVIDDALSLIRCMWDSGLAHRDIKPANVMLSDGRVVLIDVAFGTVRPSPWRQAVDLANMMLILGMRTDAELVYQRALLQFAPEDIAEAFASTRSVTLPSQSRSSLALLKKEQGIDMIEKFRELAPDTEPISIQRWSPRRLRLTAGAVVFGIFAVILVITNISGGGLL
ncbi:MAG: phosphatase PAP2 family protein [Acidimicrobiia bacterium]|nr:phosphatase PAP2 family protein [Acidimicrobiia bacterium]